MEAHRSGEVSTDEVVERLRHWPVSELGDLTIDTHRVLRTGLPEVIYGKGKTPAQVLDAARILADAGQEVLATRLADEALTALREAFGERLEVDIAAGAAWLPSGRAREVPDAPVLVLSAGTSDLPVAREAAFTARAAGLRVETAWDVGVAGIHRLMAHRERLSAAGVVIAVAGMDGALPGVVAGLTPAPVIAVPTSVGYGAGAGGIAPLLTMLNACAPGVTVVNIDNGFGAACAAWKMMNAGSPQRPRVAGDAVEEEGEDLVLDCNLDDMPGTTLGDAMARLFEAGALDVWFTPIQMKKNRPAVQLSVLGRAADRDSLLDLVFTHTTTLGVRLRPTRRVVLDRRIDTEETPPAPVRIKRASWQGREVNARPEPDDLADLSRKTGVPIKDLEKEL